MNEINFVIPGYPAMVGHSISAMMLKEGLEEEGIKVSVSTRANRKMINHAHVNDLISPSTYNKNYLSPFINPFYKNDFAFITAYGTAAPNLNDIKSHIKYWDSIRGVGQLSYLYTAHHFPKLLKPSFFGSEVIATTEYLKQKMQYESNVSHIELINPVMKPQVDEYKETKEKVVLFTGKGNGVRGDINLLKAIPEVVKQDPEILFVIANKTNNPECKRIISELDISDNVELFGKLEGIDIEMLISIASICVYPYVCDYSSTSVPISMLEAMTHAKPIISTKVGAIPEIIKGNGELISPDSVSELSDSILKMFDSNLRKYGEKSLKLIEKEYSPVKISKKYIKIYDSIEPIRSGNIQKYIRGEDSLEI